MPSKDIENDADDLDFLGVAPPPAPPVERVVPIPAVEPLPAPPAAPGYVEFFGV